MASYQSRHQPRRQLVVTGKVLQPETYDRFYDLATDALRAGRFPAMRLPAGQLLLRAASARLSIDQARQVPPGSSMNGHNRFSGPRLDGRPGQGALYVGTVAGTLREHLHYTLVGQQPRQPLGQPGLPPLWAPGQPDRLRAQVAQARAGALPPGGNRFHLYRLARPLAFADLRLTALAPLWQQLRASGETQQRYGIVAHAPLDQLLSAASQAQDYSAARGLADAVADAAASTGHAGVCAFSSRADTETGLVTEAYGDASGGLVFAIFGRDGLPAPGVVPANAPPAAGPAQVSFDSLQQVLATLT